MPKRKKVLNGEYITPEVVEMREIRFVLKKLKEVQDPRQLWKIRHSLVDILAIRACSHCSTVIVNVIDCLYETDSSSI